MWKDTCSYLFVIFLVFLERRTIVFQCLDSIAYLASLSIIAILYLRSTGTVIKSRSSWIELVSYAKKPFKNRYESLTSLKCTTLSSRTLQNSLRSMRL